MVALLTWLILIMKQGKLVIRELGEVPFGMLVWSTGLAPNPLVGAISGVKKHPKTSSLVTDNSLNLIREDGTTNPDVWVIGDAGTIEDAPLPATAQGLHFISGGLYC